MFPTTHLLTHEQHTAAVPPAGLRARLWIEARHFFSRADAQTRCWLWLVRGDGQVRALVMPARWLHRDDVLPDLVRLFDADQDEESLPGETLEVAHALPDAPIVPVPRWSVTWGHPLQRAIRQFAAALDLEVLDALGALEAPGPFFGSVENYNCLIALDQPVRRHRLQALAEFPPLVAPLLLAMPWRPDMFGDGHESAKPRAPRRPGEALLDAIDRGRDLIGALADYHRVDRALVRSPLCREPWAGGEIPREALRLLAMLQPHARPHRARDVEPRLESLKSLPFSALRGDEIGYLAKAFERGWNATWEQLEAFAQPLQTPLYNSRDFLAAALAQAELPAGLTGISRERLGLAWAARRGLESLLRASKRWHAQPLEELPMPEASAPLVELERALQEVELEGGCIEELLTETALADEGARMHHCVADYWEDCLTMGTRIVHLQLPDGERATAEFALGGSLHDPRFSLEQLLGPCNAEVSASMDHLAHSVLGLLNAPEQRERRAAVAESAQQALRQASNQRLPRRTIRRLDARSRRELAQVLAWCEQQGEWQRRSRELFSGFIAGFQYAAGAKLIDRLQAGDALALVREPANPHDRLAVKVAWCGHKLGYIPRMENAGIARLIDTGTPLQARILAVHRERGPWNQVEMVVEPEATASAPV